MRLVCDDKVSMFFQPVAVPKGQMPPSWIWQIKVENSLIL